jgi:hypothetical protein
MNSKLSEFDGAGTQSPPSDEQRSESIAHVSLPSNHKWADEIEDLHHLNDGDGGLVRLGESVDIDVGSRMTPYTLSAGDVGYVAYGAEQLIKNSDTERVYPPSSYNDFDSFEGYIARPTTAFQSSRYGGWGISKEQLKAALRFITGGGKYNVNNISIIAFQDKPVWMAEYRGDRFLLSYDKVGEPDNILTTRTVNGIKVENEVNERVLGGIEQLIDDLSNALSIEITEFKERDGNYLKFGLSTGQVLKVNGNVLPQLTTPTRKVDELTGVHTDEIYANGDIHEITWENDELERQPGEVIERASMKSIVVGYKRSERVIDWHNKPDTVKNIATPYKIQLRRPSESTISARVLSSNCSQVLDECEIGGD